MKTIEYRSVDKSKWERGEWDNEPDKVQWPDEKTGLPCLAVRGPAGAWCGYVGVADDHPLFGKGYDGAAGDLEVHGGLTFADRCDPSGDEAHRICHVPGPDEPDHVWWFGFDCAHSFDVCPGLDCYRNAPDSAYRPLAYVKTECASLARQLSQIGGTK